MIFWGCLVFSRDFRRQQRAKFKIYFNFEGCRASRCGSACLPFGVPTGGGWSGSRACPLPWLCVPSFCPLSRFVLVVSLANMALFRVLRAFLAGFMGFVGFVLLWCFAWLVWVLCAWVVRRFKGLWRVCPCFSSFVLVFAFRFLLLSSCPALPAFLLFVLLSWLCGLAFGVGLVVVSFSLSDYTQKERARHVGASSLRVSCGCL